MKTNHCILLLILILLPFMNNACQKKSAGTVQFVKMGTGGLGGVYYFVGTQIVGFIKERQVEYKLTAESTSGSIFNVNSLLKGDFDFAIVQSDIQFEAVHGKGKWQDKGPQKDIYSICSLHGELLTLVAADDSKINGIMDLKGKKVNIGSPGSGTRQNVLDVFKSVGIDFEKDLQAEQVSPKEAPDLLQDGSIDAFFYTVGHPNATLKQVSTIKRAVHLVPIDLEKSLLKTNPYYLTGTIPIKHYPNMTNKSDVKSFGVKATLCTRKDTPEMIVYTVTKALFENLDKLRKAHAALGNIDKSDMLKSLSAPIHPGALKYYREIGLEIE